ncbi:hypothetical protein [Brucella sp. NBRC 12950]|uniref:hypothetical protein n=1 Tax=Brucella sp. NBRC 12950 TaxID=2994518 RepID=UPI0024A2784E|nr:hypothetical protein [Brucella sp. NBRC 12950]GLU28009.1 hypothetical protein Brsp01_32420 [Brucella sp. NBRC 12950]
MKNQIIHSISTVPNQNNNYCRFNVIETRLSDNFFLGEFAGVSISFKLRHVSSKNTLAAHYSFNDRAEPVTVEQYEQSRILIEAELIDADNSNIKRDMIKILGTNNVIHGFRIIISAIPNANSNHGQTKAYLSEYARPHLNADNLTFPYLTLGVQLPLSEISRHIREIEAGNTAIYEIDIIEGIYADVENGVREYRVYPDNRAVYDEIKGLKTLGSVASIRFEYIKKLKSSLLQTILQKLGF